MDIKRVEILLDDESIGTSSFTVGNDLYAYNMTPIGRVTAITEVVNKETLQCELRIYLNNEYYCKFCRVPYVAYYK